MKKILFLVFGLLFLQGTYAQSGAKKYVLIEHFTNSKCPPCASKNPAFYDLIGQAQYADDVHHISIHPKFPYPECVFYQANTVENTAWTGLYPISGTPTIVINGTTQTPSTPLLAESKLQSYLGQTSPLYLQVSESGPDNARAVKVKARAVGQIPSGNYKIFVAVAEKTINLTTPNGEPVHRDVFRKMLTAVSGDIFNTPAIGETLEFNYEFSIPNTWNASEIYVLAFVKNVDTKEILNSGTRFDPVLSGLEETKPVSIKINPNPVRELAQVSLANDEAQSVEVFASNGRRVSTAFQKTADGISVSLQNAPAGVYLMKIKGKNGLYAGKFVKE